MQPLVAYCQKETDMNNFASLIPLSHPPLLLFSSSATKCVGFQLEKSGPGGCLPWLIIIIAPESVDPCLPLINPGRIQPGVCIAICIFSPQPNYSRIMRFGVPGDWVLMALWRMGWHFCDRLFSLHFSSSFSSSNIRFLRVVDFRKVWQWVLFLSLSLSVCLIAGREAMTTEAWKLILITVILVKWQTQRIAPKWLQREKCVLRWVQEWLVSCIKHPHLRMQTREWLLREKPLACEDRIETHKRLKRTLF